MLSAAMDSRFLGQFVMPGLPGPRLDGPTRRLVREIQPGGFALGAHNIESAPQLRALTDELRSLCRDEPVIALSGEGGPATALHALGLALPSAACLAATGNPSLVFRQGDITGRALRLLGIPLAFGPVLDLATGENARDGALHGRCWGSTPDEVVSRAQVVVAALGHAGVRPCALHFPTYAGSGLDLQRDLPVLPGSIDELLAGPARPFLGVLPDFHAVMTAHVLLPEIESMADLPASLGRAVVTAFLRDQLGFAGLVLADDLAAPALRRRLATPEACALALSAGNDMALCRLPMQEVAGLVEAVARQPHTVLDDALRRIERFRRRLPRLVAFDAASWQRVAADAAALGHDIPGMDERQCPATVPQS